MSKTGGFAICMHIRLQPRWFEDDDEEEEEVGHDSGIVLGNPRPLMKTLYGKIKRDVIARKSF